MKSFSTRATAPAGMALCVAVVILAGCAGTPDCLKQQSYTQARSYPKLIIPPGLEQVASNDALTIPQAPNGPIGQYKKAPANTDPDNAAARCLTSPPPLPESTVDMSKSAADT